MHAAARRNCRLRWLIVARSRRLRRPTRCCQARVRRPTRLDAPRIPAGRVVFAVAVLYSSGAMPAPRLHRVDALLCFAPEQMRPTALALTAGGRHRPVPLVAWRPLRWRTTAFVLASAPAAYLSAQIKLPKESYALLLGIVRWSPHRRVPCASRAEADDGRHAAARCLGSRAVDRRRDRHPSA